MTNQDKWLLGLRLIVLACIMLLAALTEWFIHSSGVQAPILTMVGSAAVIMMIFPMDQTSTVQHIVRDTGTILGTGIVMYGGGRWLDDAMQRAPGYDVPVASALAFSVIVVLSVYLIASILIRTWSAISTRFRIRK